MHKRPFFLIGVMLLAAMSVAWGVKAPGTPAKGNIRQPKAPPKAKPVKPPAAAPKKPEPPPKGLAKSPWPKAHGDAQNTGRSPGSGAGIAGVKLWESETWGEVESSPAIGPDGTVYIGSADYCVYALDGSTGARKWKSVTRGPIHSCPAISADGLIYVGSDDCNVYALDSKTGKKKWTFKTGKPIYSAPAIGLDGSVYIGSTDKNVYALNGATGTEQWEFATGGPVIRCPAIGSDGTVYIASLDGKVYALNPGDGTKKWEFDTGREGVVISEVMLGQDGTVYFGFGERQKGWQPPDGKVLAVDGATGAKKWEATMNDGPETLLLAIDQDGGVYVGLHLGVYVNDRLCVLDGATGTVRSERPMDVGYCALASDSTLYMSGPFDNLCRVNLKTGDSREFDVCNSTGPPALGADGTVYFGCRDGRVFAIR